MNQVVTDNPYSRNELDETPPKVPAPKYRHAAPSAPWPWMDFDVDASEVHPLPPGLTQDDRWRYYPQSLFGNWTRDQVERCGILKIPRDQRCKLYTVTVLEGGIFEKTTEDHSFEFDPARPRALLEDMQTPLDSDVRLQALFVENMTVPVLQLLGTEYDVEPFFFASSANWIPSRYQEDPKPDSDHITVVIPFIRMMKNQKPVERAERVRTATFSAAEWVPIEEKLPYQGVPHDANAIDTQMPLRLPDNRILLQDLLALHMYRTPTTSTILSYHPSLEAQRTSAKRLQSLVQRTGDSVYWSKLFQSSEDPTFVFLAALWYPLYAWDEAFEVLYSYINTLESRVLEEENLDLTRELHKLQAHLLYYQQLLRDFRASVDFVQNTPNPAMIVLERDDAKRAESQRRLCKEAKNLISEIDRLTGQREMLSDRLSNVIHLAFATVNITDSNAMKRLARITVIDSGAMKQVAYLTMIFLPASFLANVFSMNVGEINPGTKETLARYVEVTIGLTVLTTWIAIALQRHSTFHERGDGIEKRALWPIVYAYRLIHTLFKRAFMSPSLPPPRHGEPPRCESPSEMEPAAGFHGGRCRC
ncbi:hypothetical protein JVU11DRAFT_7999 [Chiua virens]|nr:hypothetical protein JVU11DRAFT_7999 [Chiua virens]